MQKTLARCIKYGDSDTKILNLCFRNLSEHACFKARHFFQLFVGMTCEPTDIVSPRNMTASRLRQAASRIEPGGNVAPFFALILAPWVFSSIKMDYPELSHTSNMLFFCGRRRFLLPIVNCE